MLFLISVVACKIFSDEHMTTTRVRMDCHQNHIKSKRKNIKLANSNKWKTCSVTTFSRQISFSSLSFTTSRHCPRSAIHAFQQKVYEIWFPTMTSNSWYNLKLFVLSLVFHDINEIWLKVALNTCNHYCHHLICICRWVIIPKTNSRTRNSQVHIWNIHVSANTNSKTNKEHQSNIYS